MSKIKALFLLFCTLFMLPESADSASINVGSGSFVDFGGAQVTASNLSLSNSGSIDLGSAEISISHLSNQANGMIDAANSILSVAGNWLNLGAFNAMQSSVRLVDGTLLGVQVSGDTDFNELIINSSNGKTISFESGSRQAISGHLQLTGVDGSPLVIVSDNPGTAALLNLNMTATQLVDYVDVTDNYGLAQIIAPGSPADYNSIQGSNVRGWFGVLLQVPVPVIGLLGQCLLILLVMVVIYLKQKQLIKPRG